MTETSNWTVTLQTRVETWECDFNGHWNARNYGRCFQQASETLAVAATGTNPGAASVTARLIRYHKELMDAEPVRLKSAQVAEGPFQGTIVHFLNSGPKLAATALDFAGTGNALLPQADALTLRPALPRGLDPNRTTEGSAPETGVVAPLDPVRPSDLDHQGYVTFENIIRRAGVAIHVLLDDLGYTRAYSAETGISRMAVEQFVTIGAPCPAGTALRILAAPLALGRKSFSITQSLQTLDGVEIARIDTSLVAVDLNVRAAVPVPDFLSEFYR